MGIDQGRKITVKMILSGIAIKQTGRGLLIITGYGHVVRKDDVTSVIAMTTKLLLESK